MIRDLKEMREKREREAKQPKQPDCLKPVFEAVKKADRELNKHGASLIWEFRIVPCHPISFRSEKAMTGEGRGSLLTREEFDTAQAEA
ncbi:MAG: hypothetical protein LBH51_06560 [Treponema sp.]|jgi:hypothetical protein|nr:hypothetical protein [Treponema sp.]